MPLECLSQDAQGDWFLGYYQSKMKREHRIPISREVAGVILEQQQTVRDAGKQKFALLFPDKRGRPFKYERIMRTLNTLAEEKHICTFDGEVWHFQVHQFRH